MTVRAGRIENRQVVPRWRTFAETLRTGELLPLTERKPDPLDREIAEAVARSQHQPSTFATAELISVLLARGDNESARALSSKLTGDIPLTLRRVAERIGSDRETSDESSQDSSSFDATVFASSLGANARDRLRLRANNPTAWVDLALAHMVQGLHVQAEREIRFALQLAPDSRFVLRSAARLYVHLDRPEQANHVLNSSDRLQHDPWLLAAEISTSQLAFGRTSNLLRARALIEFSDSSAYAKSELLSELATAEMQSGRDSSARKLFRRSFADPTENAVAQAASWAERGKIELAPELLSIDRVYEARALENARKGHWELATSEASSWHRDQPFSVEPYWLATYSAALSPDGFEHASRIAIAGLAQHKGDRILRNNAAYSLANLGRTNDARKYMADSIRLDTVDELTDLATRGLVHFREFDIRGGRAMYQAAVDGLTRLRRLDLAAIALMHWTIEECRMHLDTAPRLIKRTRRLLPDIPNAERQTLIHRMEHALTERPGVQMPVPMHDEGGADS